MLNKVISDKNIRSLKKWLEWAERMVIITHSRPDGDAIGSSLAYWHFLKQFGKEVTVIVPNAFPDFLAWMPGTNEIIRYDKHKEEADNLIKNADVICCLDFNSLSRIDEVAHTVKESIARKMLIDHHPNPEEVFDICISHPAISSTCELVFRVICQLGCFKQMTKEMATCICAGMMTDTGGFTYNSNSKDLYFIIAELMSKGVDKDEIYRKIYHNYSVGRLRLMGFVLYEKMQVFPDYRAALISLSKREMERFQFIRGDAEGFVNMPLQMKNVIFSIFLREDTEKENRINVSLRSVGNFPCNQIAAEFFNGGGHLNASGGELFMTMNEAIKTTKAALEKYKSVLNAQK